MADDFIVEIQAKLDQSKTQKQLMSDIKEIEKLLNPLKQKKQVR